MHKAENDAVTLIIEITKFSSNPQRGQTWSVILFQGRESQHLYRPHNPLSSVFFIVL